MLQNLKVSKTAWKDVLSNLAPPHDKALASEVIDKTDLLMEKLELLLLDLEGGCKGNLIWPLYSEVILIIKSIHQLIESFQLPALCDDIVDLTDAGPGVGVSNLLVR